KVSKTTLTHIILVSLEHRMRVRAIIPFIGIIRLLLTVHQFQFRALGYIRLMSTTLLTLDILLLLVLDIPLLLSSRQVKATTI
ncbi:hypothetical protein IWW34DRAFT_716427, partial [Fusarium oxysporum f. sp. albedinis]